MDNNIIYFLQNLFRDSLALPFNYFIPPFSDISAIDHQLRKSLQHSDDLYDSLVRRLHTFEYGYFYVICDKFFLNYILISPYPDKKDFISLGPYLQSGVDDTLFNRIASVNHLDFSSLEAIKGYMHQFPIFMDNLRLISSLIDVLKFIHAPAENFEIREINLFEDDAEDIPYLPVDNYQVYANTVEKRYEIEEELLVGIAEGNIAKALAASAHFMTLPIEKRLFDELRNEKSLLYCLDTLLRKGAQRSDVHPLFLHELSGRHIKTIDNANSLSDIHQIHEKMVRDYCYLVKNKARIQYSPLIRNVLNYIEFNISSPLTLSSLAEFWHVSPSYLSKLFKNELNMNITDYIISQRIHTSLKLLSTTSMQVQEIAAFVGIMDLNYFTKIFKKTVGCTPSQYRKNLHATS